MNTDNLTEEELEALKQLEECDLTDDYGFEPLVKPGLPND